MGLLDSIISSILERYLGDYLEGVDKDHIKFGLLSGTLEIENVSLKKKAIDVLELPI
jgi:hypothetical protein